MKITVVGVGKAFAVVAIGFIAGIFLFLGLALFANWR